MNLTPRIALLCWLPLVAACGNNNPGPDASGADVITTNDATTTDTTMNSTDAPSGGGDTGSSMIDGGNGTTDVPVSGNCGSARPDLSMTNGSEGIAIAADGTIYYSQDGAVGRMRPGMSAENAWAHLPASATSVLGLALHGTTLYVASPADNKIYSIDVSAASPTATALGFDAGSPNGLTIAPDGSLCYSDSAMDQVYCVSGSTPTAVGTSSFNGANGIAFGPDGALYVDNYGDGTLVRLTLSGLHETARTTVAHGLGSPDGITFDESGAIYVTDSVGGQLFRLNPDGSGMTVLQSGLHGPANLEFGSGALRCMDLYIAGSESLLRYEM